MIVSAGMNALVRRSCACSARAFATAAKHGGSGKHNQNRRNNNQRPGNKSKPQAETKSTQETRPNQKQKQKRAPAPLVETRPNPAPKPEPTPFVTSLGLSDEQATPPPVPLPSPDPPLSAYTLSSSKLRALIDLYHSSSSFITPENLSDAIDATFAPLRHVPNMNIRYQSYRDLIAQRDELDSEPDRVVPTANELGGRGYGTADGLAGALMSSGGWSVSKGERARMVKAALWGVDSRARIGLETLLEAKLELDASEKEQKD